MIVHGFYSYLIALFSIFSIYYSYRLMLKANGNVVYVTIGMYFLLWYLVFIYVGSVMMNVYIPTIDFKQEHFEFLGVSLDRLDGFNQDMFLLEHPKYLIKIWILSTGVLYLLPIGMIMYNKIFKVKIRTLKDINYRQDSNKYTFMIAIGIFIFSIYIFYLYSLQINKFPIVALLEGYDRDMISFFRSESGNNFHGKYHWYHLFMRIIPSILLLTALVQLYIKKDVKWMLFTTVLFIYMIFILTIDTQKAPVVFLFINIFLLYIILKKYIMNKALFKKALFILIIIFISLFAMYYYFFKLEFAPFNILFSILHRIFFGQIIPFYWWQDYQEHFGYIYGLSFPNPRHIFPFEYVQISKEVMKFAHPELAKLNIIGSMPTVFYADWWINFGLTVSLLSMLLLGFIMQAFEQVTLYLLSKRFSIILLAFYVYGILFFASYTSTSYVGIIVDEKIIIPGIIIGIVYLIGNFKKRYSI